MAEIPTTEVELSRTSMVREGHEQQRHPGCRLGDVGDRDARRVDGVQPDRLAAHLDADGAVLGGGDRGCALLAVVDEGDGDVLGALGRVEGGEDVGPGPARLPVDRGDGVACGDARLLCGGALGDGADDVGVHGDGDADDGVDAHDQQHAADDVHEDAGDQDQGAGPEALARVGRGALLLEEGLLPHRRLPRLALGGRVLSIEPAAANRVRPAASRGTEAKDAG